ncbi:glycosyltransferase [Nitrogeniibacter mangrovi]|uniref:Glycosyltransferase n=1 Tax=Nitrogeniibacter mangrovi TaxID=2016596 RepID=A0A6C1B129_9RHOO|nr:glycosyltransferase [Nitrogeniibacter mangrovi]QID17326.1 glycosyltransferase [Nitrogeniibacter mangrovi]
MTGKHNASNARVGIIVPAYNYGHYLDECLGSLAAQTWGDFTALVIDNASTDDTEDVARAWVARDARFRYVRNDTNLGLTRSMLKAYALLDNELMMLLSADDLLAPRFLEATVGALDAHPECPMAYTAWETMLDNPGDPAHGQRGQAFIPHQRSGVYDDSAVLLSHNWITISIGIWRRQACEVVGGFDPQGLRHLGDWFLWMRLLSEGPAYYVHEPLGAYRIHSAAESRRLISSNQSGDDHVRFYDLIYANERWPMTIRCLAKAHQMRWMTGEPMMSIVDKLGGPRAHPIIRLMMESVRHDVIVGAARAVLEYTPEPNTLDTSANAIAALAQVLAEAPGHAAARALLAEHGGAGAPNAPIALTDAAARRAKAWITADLARHTPAAAITVLIDARHEGPLRRTLRSLDHQWHPAARIVLVDAPEQPAEAGYHCLSSKDLDDWIAARHAEPGWLLGLAAGDELADDALYHCARAIDTHPQARLVYTDHDEIGRDDCHRNPNHKPDANPELLRSTPYIGRALVAHTAHLVDATAPLDLVSSHRIALETLDTAGAEALVHVPALLMHLDARTAITLPGSPEQSEALNAMVHAHAGRLHPGTTVIDGPGIGQFAWLPPLDATPLVSIIVPTKDQLDLLRRCLDTLMHQTKYPAFEVIVVDNDSQTDEARAYLANLEAGVDPRIRVLRHPGVFNFSAMNNRAASIANGAYLLLLNNDTEVIDPYWLNTMMRHATRDAVGAVGPLLVLPDGRIQHAGVILGLRGPANHPFIGDDPEAPGYLGRVHLQQNFSAVGGACLLTRKSLYLRLGGLDETDFSVSYNDIDYCLRLREAGYEVTWTPLARLIHLGSASQLIDIEDMSLSQKITRFQGEQLNMVCKWASLIAHDPAYNPNLTVRGVGFEPESEPLLRFDPLAHLGQARVLALIAAAPGTCRHRILEPLCALKAAGTITGGLLPAPVDPHLVLHTGADRLILQLPDTLNELDGLRNLTALPDLHTLLDGDDLLRPLPYLDNTQPDFLADPGEQTALFIRSCDTILASNPRLAAAFAPLHDDVRVVPERLHPALWSAPPEPLRAGEVAGPVRAAWWSSSATDAALIDALQTHFGDRVRFICLGACPPALAERSSVLTPPAAAGLPAWLAEQHWDVGLLPLVDGAVAALGSDIDLQRLGWVGCPVLCSDVPAFCGDLPVTRLPQDAEAWIAALGALIDAPERRAMEGAALQQAVLRTMGSLTNAPDAWRDSVVGAPSSGALAVELEDCEALLAELLLPLSPATPRPRAAANAPAHPRRRHHPQRAPTMRTLPRASARERRSPPSAHQTPRRRCSTTTTLPSSINAPPLPRTCSSSRPAPRAGPTRRPFRCSSKRARANSNCSRPPSTASAHSPTACGPCRSSRTAPARIRVSPSCPTSTGCMTRRRRRVPSLTSTPWWPTAAPTSSSASRRAPPSIPCACGAWRTNSPATRTGWPCTPTTT